MALIQREGMSEEARAFQQVLDTSIQFADVSAEAWEFAIQAAAAMDDARHEWVTNPWQCGYDDAIYEGMYDFITFQCQCPECEAEYKQGFEAGMKAED